MDSLLSGCCCCCCAEEFCVITCCLCDDDMLTAELLLPGLWADEVPAELWLLLLVPAVVVADEDGTLGLTFCRFGSLCMRRVDVVVSVFCYRNRNIHT